MSCGDYRERITIEKIKDNPQADAHGETDLTDDSNWETYATRFSSIQTKGGREFWKVDKVDADVNFLIRVQHDKRTAEITPRMRIRLGKRTINIAAVYDVDEMHEVIEMQCKEPK